MVPDVRLQRHVCAQGLTAEAHGGPTIAYYQLEGGGPIAVGAHDGPVVRCAAAGGEIAPLDPRRHGEVAVLKAQALRALQRQRLATVKRQRVVEVPRRVSRGAARSVARRVAGWEIPGVVPERRGARWLVEGQPQLSVVRGLAPVGDLRLGLLGQRERAGCRCLRHPHLAGQRGRPHGFQDEGLRRRRLRKRAALYRVNAVQPLGVTIIELVRQRGGVDHRRARPYDEVAGVVARVGQRSHLLGRQRPVERDHFVEVALKRLIRLPVAEGGRADEQIVVGIRLSGLPEVDGAASDAVDVEGDVVIHPHHSGDVRPLTGLQVDVVVVDVDAIGVELEAAARKAQLIAVAALAERRADQGLPAGDRIGSDPGGEGQVVAQGVQLAVGHAQGVLSVEVEAVDVAAVRGSGAAGARGARGCLAIARRVAEALRSGRLIKAEQEPGRVPLPGRRGHLQYRGIGGALGVEAVDPLFEIGERVVVGIHEERVRGHAGPQLLTITVESVDDLPPVQLLAVGQAVAVGVLTAGVGARAQLLRVVEAVAVGVVHRRVGALLVLKGIVEPIAIGVPLAVIGVGAALDLRQEPVAVKVGLHGEAGCAALGRRRGLCPIRGIATALRRRLIEPVQRGREDVDDEAVPQIEVACALLLVDGAHGDETGVGHVRRHGALGPAGEGETLLHWQHVPLGEVERGPLVETGWAQRDGRTGWLRVDAERVLLGRGLPFIAHRVEHQALEVLLLRLPAIVKDGLLSVFVLELPGVGHRLPIRRKELRSVLPPLFHLVGGGRHRD